MTRRHPEARALDDLAYRMTRDAKLIRQLADNNQAAQTHINQELSVLGWPQRAETRGSSDFPFVERDANISYQFTAICADMRDQRQTLTAAYHDLCQHIKAMGLVIHAARTTGLSAAERKQLAAASEPVCCDNQVGKHAADEWGDGNCQLAGVKAGLCLAHYMAWYRARQRDGIDTSRDHGDAA